MSGIQELSRVLGDVRRRIARAKADGLNEQNTKATLIEPVLRALGWDVEDVEEVVREYGPNRRAKPVDYALLVVREPRLLVEAKALGENLDDFRWANQIMGYATVAGVEWIVLTDGDQYRIYKALESVRVEEKLLCSVRLTEDRPECSEILALLSKDQLKTNRIDELWKAYLVDRQVGATLKSLLGGPRGKACGVGTEKRTMRWRRQFLVPTALCMSGCATIFGQATQVLQIRTEPPGAEVSIEDRKGTEVWRGVAPSLVPLRAGAGLFRGQQYTITASKDGQSATVVVDTTINGLPYLIGNLVFGGLLGWFIVDPISGAMWYLPREVVINTDADQRGLVGNKSSLIALKRQRVAVESPSSNPSLPQVPLTKTPPSYLPSVPPQVPVPVTSHSENTEYRILEEWQVPGGGVGRIILVKPIDRSAANLRSLGQQLSHETSGDPNALIFVYDDERAAASRMAPDDYVSPEDAAFCDIHFVGTYVRNAKTRTNVLHANFEDAAGKRMSIKIR